MFKTPLRLTQGDSTAVPRRTDRYAIGTSDIEHAQCMIQRIGDVRVLFTEYLNLIDQIPEGGMLFNIIPRVAKIDSGVRRLRLCNLLAQETGVDQVYIAQRVGIERNDQGIPTMSWETSEPHLLSLFAAIGL